MSDGVDSVTLGLLALAGLLAVVRIVRSGSLPNRVLGADTFNAVVVGAVAVGAAVTEDATFLDVLVVVTLLGFIGNVTVARYIEKQGVER